MTRSTRLTLSFAAALCAATTASAQQRAPISRPSADPAPARAAAPAIPPEKAFLDFSTGRFREVTPEDLAALEKMRAEDTAAAAPAQAGGIVEQGHGVRSAVVPESHHLGLAVRERPDGTLEIVCAPMRSVGRRLGQALRPRAEEQ